MGYCMQMSSSHIFVSTENTGRVMAKLRNYPYRFDLDDDGNITGISFTGHKLSDEFEVFQKVAPYIRNGSYIEMRGDDGDRWKWAFQNGTCQRVTQHTLWRYG